MSNPLLVPPFVSMGPPPLPPSWSEYIGPTGQPYYYNALTEESTYTRPLPAFSPYLQTAAPPQQQLSLPPTKKKEKPVKKTPIPGTDWLRVMTTEGNVFFTNKVEKTSVWTVPEEIRDLVAALDDKEAQEGEKQGVARDVEESERKDRMHEVERIKAELQEVKKRKAEEIVPVDEFVITKKAKVTDEAEEDNSDSDSEEEEWQREAAAVLTAEAEEERKRREEEEAEKAQAEAEAEAEKSKQASSMPQLNMPDRVDLSIEEAKALFKTLLREKDISPLQPWDTALPLFISDPRYVLLPSVSARREAFDEYCRDRARELRETQVKKEKESADPKEAFDRLLREEVKSTRTSWADFRRQWKKDRRFWGWGRDDREREKKFKEYLKQLGEKKRAAALKAEADFFALLKESGHAEPGSEWKEVKHHLYKDPRYDAVGSSSLRQELFNTFLKAQTSTSAEEMPSTNDREFNVADTNSETERVQEKRGRKERAVREREERVKAERNKLEADINRSKMGLTMEEGDREFRTMLVDAIRDPQLTWDAALPELQTDPRFTRSPLPLNQQLHLFHTHVGQLRVKHLDNLYALFASHSPSLATSFTDLPMSSLMSSLPATKLGLDSKHLQLEFEKWQRERNTESREAFDKMLHENSFVDFWGRLRNMGGEGADGGVKADELGEDEGEGGGGTADLKTLAKIIDIREVEKVLKNDRRYLMFDHAPQQRERWIRDYLSQLSGPKLSVHVPEHPH